MASRIVLLDTNALLMPFQFRVNLETELGRLMGSADLAIPSPVWTELEFLAERDRDARAALQLAAREAVPCRAAESPRALGRHEGIREPLLRRTRQTDRGQPTERVPEDPRTHPRWLGGPRPGDPPSTDPSHPTRRRGPSQGVRRLPTGLRAPGGAHDCRHLDERTWRGRLLHAAERLPGAVPQETVVRAVRGHAELEDERTGPGEDANPSGQPRDRDHGLRGGVPDLRRSEAIPGDREPCALGRGHDDPDPP